MLRSNYILIHIVLNYILIRIVFKKKKKVPLADKFVLFQFGLVGRECRKAERNLCKNIHIIALVLNGGVWRGENIHLFNVI